MSLHELIEATQRHYPDGDLSLLGRAVDLAARPTDGSLDGSLIVARLRLDPPAVAATTVLDAVAVGALDVSSVEDELGSEVALLVDNLLRVARIRWDRLEEEAAESLRKMFLALASDIRVVIISVARRVHVMRLLEGMTPEERQRTARETMEVFAPLANRLGLWHLKSELEDRAFAELEPAAFEEIRGLLAETQGSRDELLRRVADVLQERLDKAGIEAELSRRSKHIHSIHSKMQRKGVEFSRVYDLSAVRMIVPEVSDCYAALGLIHGLWPPIAGEFDDYIAKPKDNFYRSLHTAVFGPDGHPVEIQIRTREMHEFAEYGIAAHWRYKEGGRKSAGFDRQTAWLNQLIQWQKELPDPREFVDSLKTDVFQDQVHVFTPGGDVIDLPAGATPIDFAYRIHTEVGHSCRGARVNEQIVPLDHPLETGDRVEILKGKPGGPSRDWLNPQLGYVRTATARQKIRQFFRLQSRDASIAQGRESLDKELRKLGLTDKPVGEIAEMLGYDSADDMLAKLGYGDISLHKVASRLLEAERRVEQVEIPTAPGAEPVSRATSVSIGDVDDVLSHPARCCNPVPGDPAIGFVTRGRGITIHRRDCPNVRNHPEPERLMPLEWGAKAGETHPVHIRIVANDRAGLLRDIADVISQEGVSLSAANVSTSPKELTATIHATLEVAGSDQLLRILDRVERLPFVLGVRRVGG
jgi:GTP pyrophosphokinase